MLLLSATMILTVVCIRKTENKILSETTNYIRNYIIHLETADYSFAADVIDRLKGIPDYSGTAFSEEAGKVFLSYNEESGDSFSEWFYRKNMKTFFESAVESSKYLISADLYQFAEGEAKSLVYSSRSSSADKSIHNKLKERNAVTEYKNSECRYSGKIESYRFRGSSVAGAAETERGYRVLELVFDYSEINMMILFSSVLFISFTAAFFVFFLIYLLPEIRFYFEGRLENISNSLDEVIKGNRGVRIYIPGNDLLAGIAESINTVLEDSVREETEFIREKEKYNLFFENIPTGVIILDSEGKLVFENRFIKSLVNGDSEPFPGVFYSVLNRDDSDTLFENLSYVISGEKNEYIHRCRLFRGSFRHQFFEIRIKSAVKGDNIRYVIITFTDLSSSVSRDNPNIDYLKTGGLSKLAGTIANGMNNILHIINGYMEYLLLGGIGESEFRSVVENMLDAVRRARVLTRHLKIFSIENRLAKPVLISVNDLVSDLETIIREIFNSRIALEIIYDESDPECLGDEGQLEQVIINLCINAAEAISGEGTVEISTGRAEYSESDVKGYPEASAGEYIYIRVKDSGSGIPEDQLRKIFEPFYSTRKNGEASGMGLSLSYSIIMSCKGFIHVKSEEGRGSIFTVNIPAAGPAAESLPGKANEAVAEKKNNETILFVDDEELIVSLGKIMLEKAGYRVLTASNGNEAFETVKSYEGEIHLMVVDLVMPGLSGPETAEKIRTVRGGLPVLYISGYAEKEIGTVNENSILSKPFKSTELISKISDMLEKKPPR